MPLSPYDPCPCGSGKKLKFCCQSLAEEMDRISRLADGNQPHVALQQLEKLARKLPANPWIGTTRAMIYLALDDATTARDVLRDLLEHCRDNEFALVLLATAIFQAEGLDAAKTSIHRAFQRGAKKFPTMISGLAATMASLFTQRQQVMAAREHLSLALRLSQQERRQECFVQLLKLDGDETIPYPLRGTHLLPKIEGTEDQQKEIKKAHKYAGVGCWSTAADLFQSLGNTLPNSAEVWHSIGLCRAWDGAEALAAEALHRASQLYTEDATAVECETLAQLFDRNTSTDVIETCTYESPIVSVGRLLTTLDEQPRFVRVKLPTSVGESLNRPVATYQVLDRPQLCDVDFTQLTLEKLPRLQAHLTIYDPLPDSDQQAALFLSGDRGPELEESRSLLEAATTGLIKWRTDKPQPEVTGGIPAELQSLRWRWIFPEPIPVRCSRELIDQQWRVTLDEVWMTCGRKGLHGRTPREAAAEPAQRIPLLAAIHVLDSQCESQGRTLDLEQMLAKLGLLGLPPLEVDEQTSLSSQSVMNLHRILVERLTDAQLTSVANRALLTRHSRFLYQALKAVAARPSCEEEVEASRVYRTLTDLCAKNGQREEAFRWINAAREKEPRQGSNFEHQWSCDMTELSLRLESPEDPALKPLLDRFVTYYSPKVPQMRGHVERLLETYGVPSPWDTGIVVVDGQSGSTTGKISPTGSFMEQAPTTAPLWLPGQ